MVLKPVAHVALACSRRITHRLVVKIAAKEWQHCSGERPREKTACHAVHREQPRTLDWSRAFLALFPISSTEEAQITASNVQIKPLLLQLLLIPFTSVKVWSGRTHSTPLKCSVSTTVSLCHARTEEAASHWTLASSASVPQEPSKREYVTYCVLYVDFNDDR